MINPARNPRSSDPSGSRARAPAARRPWPARSCSAGREGRGIAGDRRRSHGNRRPPQAPRNRPGSAAAALALPGRSSNPEAASFRKRRRSIMRVILRPGREQINGRSRRFSGSSPPLRIGLGCAYAIRSNPLSIISVVALLLRSCANRTTWSMSSGSSDGVPKRAERSLNSDSRPL